LKLIPKQQADLIYERYCTPSRVRAWWAVVFTWAGIIATLYGARRIGQWWAIPPALLILAALQHRFFTIYHEAFHGVLFRSKFWNREVAKWLAAYPSLVLYDNARRRHMAHHAYAATERDPERVSHLSSWRDLGPLLFPWPSIARSMLARWGLVARRSTPLLPGRAEWDAGEHTNRREQIELIVVQGGLFSGLFLAFGLWGLLYHTALLVMIRPTLETLRQWVEHYNGDLGASDPRYVVVTSNVLERFFLAPMHFNLHAAHHLNPKVPFHRLPDVQRLIDEHAPHLIRRTSYARVIMELPWRTTS
jgi:fatty acid desaturase